MGAVEKLRKRDGAASVTAGLLRLHAARTRIVEREAVIDDTTARGGNRDPLAGSLRLGAIYTIGPYLLPKLIPILRKTAPAMQLLIQENFTHVLGDESTGRHEQCGDPRVRPSGGQQVVVPEDAEAA